jgi:hypothetical protein
MQSPTTLRRAVAALAMGSVLIAVVPAGAAGKPARDLVPAGATVLYFTSFPTPLGGVSASSGSISVTDVKVIDEIRGLINALPVSDTRNRVCPDDMMVPSYVSFAVNATTAAFAKVLFQLGGCPYARVYLHGVAESPTVGGANLGVVFSKIRRLVDDQA